MHGDIRAGAHGHANVCCRQRRRVIHAVADHDYSAPALPTACGSLPPEGVYFSLGRPGGKIGAPALVASRTALPPEGVHFSLLKFGHQGGFVTRQHFGHHLVGVQAQALAHGQGGAAVVA